MEGSLEWERPSELRTTSFCPYRPGEGEGPNDLDGHWSVLAASLAASIGAGRMIPAHLAGVLHRHLCAGRSLDLCCTFYRHAVLTDHESTAARG